MRKKILILTNSKDSHTHALIHELNKYNAETYRVDLDRFHTHFSFQLDYSSDPYFICDTPVGRFHSHEIDSVWIRRPYDFYFKENNFTTKQIKFDVAELVRNLPEFLSPKCLIVDKPNKVQQARKKLTQLAIAKQLNIKIPDTILTNTPDTASEFIKNHHNKAVVKSYTVPNINNDTDTLTFHTRVIDNDTKLDSIRNCPTLLQQALDKKFDIRVTIIGSLLTAVRFRLPESLYDEVIDWRLIPDEKILNINHEVIDLPASLRSAIMKFVKYYQLNYSAIDLVQDKNDEYYFLENNPVGQFLWMDDVAGTHLGEEMAKFLIGK